MATNLDREVSMQCSTCGGTQFDYEAKTDQARANSQVEIILPQPFSLYAGTMVIGSISSAAVVFNTPAWLQDGPQSRERRSITRNLAKQ